MSGLTRVSGSTGDTKVDSVYRHVHFFNAGFTLTGRKQLACDSLGRWYRYIGQIPAGGLVVPAGSSPDINWEDYEFGRQLDLAELDVINTASISGYKNLSITCPLYLDSDAQGIKLNSNVTVTGDSWSHPFKAKAAYSVLRLNGDNIRIKGVAVEGGATSSDTQTSEGITSRMYAVVDGKTAKDLVVEDYSCKGMTTGIALESVDGAVLKNLHFTGNVYSPTGLNSAGGYGLLVGGGTKRVHADGIHHILQKGKDRHCCYISSTTQNVDGTDVTTGWENVNLSNIMCDWTANTRDNGIFAMNPLHFRVGSNFSVNNLYIKGRAGAALAFNKQHGDIQKGIVSGVFAKDMESYQNGTLMKNGVFDGYSNWPNYKVKDVRFSNFDVAMIRGVDSSGNRMPAASDNGALFTNVDRLSFTNGTFTMESGPAISLTNGTGHFIDGIRDILVDQTSPEPTIRLDNVTKSTIGRVWSDRPDAIAKSPIYTLTNCTDITCLFPRMASFTITGGGFSNIVDRWSILGTLPTLAANGTVEIPLQAHTTNRAALSSRVEINTGSAVRAVRISATGEKRIRFQLIDTTTGNMVNANTANVGITIHLVE